MHAWFLHLPKNMVRETISLKMAKEKVYPRDKGSQGSGKTEKEKWLSGSPKKTDGEEILRAQKQRMVQRQR